MEKTTKSIFITGKAGTGKSTLLRYFRATTKKNVVVIAPTGVAAVNIGGQTIHSFFRFPPRFIQKDDIRRLKKYRKLIGQLDSLILDEVSMVRADLMDGIDYALRINRDKMDLPFGGVQVILFGDLFQLPPVVDNELAKTFERRYGSPYFFSSGIIQKVPLESIELSKIFRQSEPDFIALLNKIRNNRYGEPDLEKLNKRVIAEGDSSKNEAIILTTTNERARQTNEAKLNTLPGPTFEYHAHVTGKFDEPSYPNDYTITLRKGAQVMLIRNDANKRWVNGTIGHVEAVSKESITLSIDGRIHNVPRTTWEKIKYEYDEVSGKIVPEGVGAFEQYPIKLAWAITIHKSQGKTFDDVIVDLGDGAFTHGQVYVALSRCASFSGLKLRTPVIASDVIFDKRILEFTSRLRRPFITEAKSSTFGDAGKRGPGGRHFL